MRAILICLLCAGCATVRPEPLPAPPTVAERVPPGDRGRVVSCDGQQVCPQGWISMDERASTVVLAITESERACREALRVQALPCDAGWPPWAVLLVGGAVVILAGAAGAAVGYVLP